MVISNLPFEEWTEVFGSERLTGAFLDRITYRCHVLEANGESYRLPKLRNIPNVDHLECEIQPNNNFNLKKGCAWQLTDRLFYY
jgi:hypothetical protein